MDKDKYLNTILSHLRSGSASADAWDEVGEHLFAASESVEPLLIDIECGFAVECVCGNRVWVADGDFYCDQCGVINEKKVELLQ